MYIFRILPPISVLLQAVMSVSCSGGGGGGGASGGSSGDIKVNIDAKPGEAALPNNYAYVSTENGVNVCTIDPKSNLLSECKDSGSGLRSTTGVFYNAGFLYVLNFPSSSITYCKVQTTDGSLTNCINTASGISLTYFPQITMANGNAYISGHRGVNDGTTYKCILNSADGSLGNCVSYPPTFNYFTPIGIATNSNYIYLANNTDIISNVAKCDLATGQNCVITGTGFNQPASFIVLNNYLYVSSTAKNMMICKVNTTDGTLNSCEDSTVTDIFVGMSTNNNSLYYTIGNNVKVCDINSDDGTVANCRIGGPNFSGATGITFTNNSTPIIK